jgi:hypothetical protein
MADDQITLGDKDNISYFSISVGDTVRVCRPQGFKPWRGSKPAGMPDPGTYYQYGFTVMYKEIGQFEDKMAENSYCVKYKHLKSGKQIIRYDAGGALSKDTAFYIVLQPVIVHDHASVYQGGPAYATYYADKPQEEGS